MPVASTPLGIDKDANVNDSDKAIPAKKDLAQKKSRRRFIFNFWPRDPKGEVITPENSFFGKETPEKTQLWGATLNNFFYTHRIGSCEDGKPLRGSLTISTSSKLLGWMEKHGENYSIDDMDEARMEPDPEVIEPFDIAEIIREQEKVAVRHALDAALKGLPPRSALQSPRYPMPWPRPPFSSDNVAWPEPPMLEKLISLSHLPKTFIVHDPWGTTDGEVQNRKNTWKRPIQGSKALLYHLQLSKAGEERAQRELEEVEKVKEEEDKILAKFLADPHTRNKVPLNGFILTRDDVDVTPIFCLLPSAPTVDPDEPAHLRLSPSHYLGSGHHSVLYDAEFELPRDLLAERPICKPCIADAAIRIWDEEEKGDSARESANTESERSLNIMTGSDVRQYMDRGYGSIIDGYDGPICVVRVDVDYFKPFDKPCKHYVNMPEEIRYPPTATVRVAAKLSKRNDNHLDTEAKNYEAFPVHFFQHWSGLCIPPRHRHPVPVGAIAPQYYGYYVFDKLVDDDDPIAEGPLTEKQSKDLEDQENLEAAGKNKSKYYSPIMLLENCGKPIESTELSIDDREEAVSLFNRFHHAGWCHLSLYQRNIVMKPGPIYASPKERLRNSKLHGGLGERWSFRLIDYGRSCVWNNENHPRYDKYATENMSREAVILWNWLNTDGHHPDP